LPSSTVNDSATDFAPDSNTLDTIVRTLAHDGARSGGAVDEQTRREALALFGDLPVAGGKPGRTWRYNYDKLPFEGLEWTTGRLAVPTMPVPERSEDPEVDYPALETANAGGLVHLGAIALEPARPMPADPRIIVMPLADAVREHSKQVSETHLAIAGWRSDRFAALSTAFQNCGAFVYVPDGVVLDAPIQLVFTTTEAQACAVFPHIVVVLGTGARATVMERYAGEGDAFICGIVEAHVGANAQLDFVTVQQADPEARVFSTRAARCESNASMRWHLAELGGALARTVLSTNLVAPGSRGEASALFFTGGTQHVELTTTTEHTIGNTTSDTVVRSAATDRGQGRFFGNINIHAHSHGSDASLRDDALLLSKHANIDSVPALEIAANDVKAFHGATIGSLDEDTLFYARSRGIALPDALRMIALGFFEPVISRFPGERLRDEIRTALDHKIDGATEIDV
jgi:Fe-S cluster assembly protein SufD